MIAAQTEMAATVELLTAEETGQILRLSAEAVRDLVKAGRIPGRKVGGRVRVDKQQLLDFVRTGTTVAR